MVLMGKTGITIGVPHIDLNPYKRGAPPGTVPIGGSGWYATPNKPIDPTDCNNYSRSPYCGGNPFDNRPAAIGVDVSVHNCGFDVVVSGVIGFVATPDFKLSYRFPGVCRNDPPTPGQLPPLEPGQYRGVYPSVDPTLNVFAFIGEDSTDENQNGYTGHFTSYICPGDYGTVAGVYKQFQITGVLTDSNIFSGESAPFDINFHMNFDSGGYIKTLGIAADGTIVYDVFNNQKTVYNNLSAAGEIILYQNRVNYGARIMQGLSGLIQAWIENGSNFVQPPGSQMQLSADFVVQVNCSEFLNPYKNNPPPLLPDKKCNCMQCCNDPTDNNDALLRQILAAVQQANNALGTSEYPVKVPANILVRQGLSNAQVSIPNATQLIEWYVKQFDAVVGRFGIDLQVQDSDPTTPGDQPLKMNLPNLAESVAEMVGLLLHISMTVDSLQNINIRNLVETGSSKQQSFVNFLYLKALSDYMGFPRNDKAQPMTLSFKPNETALDKLLVDTQIQVKGIEYNTSKPRLKDNLQDLLHAAAIIKALHWRKIDPQGDIKSQLFNLIKTQAANALNIGQNVDPKTGKSDFDQFIQDFEDGFQEYTNLDTDLETNPYGRPYAQRPQVKKLGDPNAGTSNQQPGTNIPQQ